MEHADHGVQAVLDNPEDPRAYGKADLIARIAEAGLEPHQGIADPGIGEKIEVRPPPPVKQPDGDRCEHQKGQAEPQPPRIRHKLPPGEKQQGIRQSRMWKVKL